MRLIVKLSWVGESPARDGKTAMIRAPPRVIPRAVSYEERSGSKNREEGSRNGRTDVHFWKATTSAHRRREIALGIGWKCHGPEDGAGHDKLGLGVDLQTSLEVRAQDLLAIVAPGIRGAMLVSRGLGMSVARTDLGFIAGTDERARGSHPDGKQQHL